LPIAAIRSSLETATSENSPEVFRAQASAFEEDLLGVPQFPDEYADLFVEIMSTSRFFSKEGAWRFVVKVYTDRDKLTESQKEKILDAFVASFGEYPEEKLCLTVSDFIARTYAPEKALEAFDMMVRSATRAEQLDAILVGLEILFLNLERDSDLWKQTRELLKTAQNKASRIH
jgi:hypothetical protein